MTTKTDISLPPMPTIDVMGKSRKQVWFTADEVDALRRAAVEADRQGRMPSDESISGLWCECTRAWNKGKTETPLVQQFARALLSDYDRMRDALWVVTEHNALHFGESHNTVIVGRAALAQEQGGSDGKGI